MSNGTAHFINTVYLSIIHVQFYFILCDSNHDKTDLGASLD